MTGCKVPNDYRSQQNQQHWELPALQLHFKPSCLGTEQRGLKGLFAKEATKYFEILTA